MSEHDDLTTFDSDDGLASEDAATWGTDPTQDGWSGAEDGPTDGPPPLDADNLAPHEQADDGLIPPEPEPGPDAELGDPPPLPPTDAELPPPLPDEPVDLSSGGDDAGAPMPPVSGDTTTAPPTGGDVDLSTDGPPVAPAGDGDGGTPQSPVPEMGSESTGRRPLGDIEAFGDVELGTDDGAPMPPVTGDTTTEPPTGEVDLGNEGEPLQPTVPNSGVDEGQSVIPEQGNEGTELGTIEEEPAALVVVEPGQERITAAAVTGAFLDEMGMDDPARERMIELLTEAAADGEITEDELYAAFEQAGFEETPTDGTGTSVTTIINEAPRSAVVRIEGEGLGPFRVSANGDTIELESLRSGSVYAARPQDVEQAWRDSGARLITAPADPIAATEPKKTAGEAEDDSDDTRRNLLIAGAVLLPLAGGATYLATRKIR
jgi:hypothetical protein